MRVDDIELPSFLEELLAEGRWPRGRYNANGPVAVGAQVEAVEPGWQEIWLWPPPFHTVEADNLDWFDQFRHSDEISFGRAVIIGDFGPGSDCPIVLDHRQDPPTVVALRLSARQNREGGQRPGPEGADFRVEGRWVVIATRLEDFVAKIGL